MNKHGFTMIELLTVVVIIAVLVAIAAPQYGKAVERARATEAMTFVKNINDAIYTYAAARSGNNACPNSFHKLVVTLPVQNDHSDQVAVDYFRYELNNEDAPYVPGTPCHGVIATRVFAGSKYDYVIWNPFASGTTGKAPALGCYSPSGNTDSIEICKSLGIYADGM